MMSMLFKQKRSVGQRNKEIAKNLYACALENTRQEIFYTEYEVPDNFDGRFDLLLLHIFLILHRIMDQDNYEDLSQDLFDVMFKDMDQTLREMGIGDVGVPKHMKRMMKAFNGRMYNYQMAVAPETLDGHDFEDLKKADLEDVLARNLYGKNVNDNAVDKASIDKICVFVQSNLKRNDDAEIEKLMGGQADFINAALQGKEK